MVEVAWTVEGTTDLEHIRRYVANFDEKAAIKLNNRLVAAAKGLADFPRRGRPVGNGRRALTIIWPYLIFHRVEGDLVRILSVRHGARRPLAE